MSTAEEWHKEPAKTQQRFTETAGFSPLRIMIISSRREEEEGWSQWSKG